MQKSFLVSKRVWLNVVALGLAVANHYVGSTIPAIDPQIVAMIVGGINLGLIFVSKKQVTLTLPVLG